MYLADHYKILELEPSATLPEIKKAYRRLALIYHPDKNSNDPYAHEQFRAIKEAYEILTNPAKKEFYLQQRWYKQSTGSRRSGGVVTPVTILKQLLELDKYVSTLDIHRMDKQGLADHIEEILSEENIEKLNRFNEPSINREITQLVLHCGMPLPLQLQEKIAERLEKINNDQVTKESIRNWTIQRRQTDRWERYKPWLIAVVVLLLSLLIFFAA